MPLLIKTHDKIRNIDDMTDTLDAETSSIHSRYSPTEWKFKENRLLLLAQAWTLSIKNPSMVESKQTTGDPSTELHESCALVSKVEQKAVGKFGSQN